MNLLPFFITAFSLLFSDTSTITDSRDGQTYKVVKIGDYWWFQEDLRYYAPGSYCDDKNHKKDCCKASNFYSFDNLGSVCPDGWHVATEEEWKSYLAHELERHAMALNDLKLDTLPHPNNTYMYIDTTSTLQLTGDGSLLQIANNGWIEGRRHKGTDSGNYWAPLNMDGQGTNHLHMNAERMFLHTHDHHIRDRKSNQRKFNVRCTCEGEIPQQP
ncbi:MAG: hypothetical protein KDC12_02690 [Flavobacteriales bacterium]|nr:hypothetical protein [Flavobacteriales bacterium]